MSLYELEKELPDLLEEVGELVKQDVSSIDRVILKYRDQAADWELEDQGIHKMIKEIETPDSLLDKLNPFNLAMEAYDYFTEILMDNMTGMEVTNRNIVLVNRRIADSDTLRSFLVHELTHVVDLNCNGMYEKQKEIFRDMLETNEKAKKQFKGYIKTFLETSDTIPYQNTCDQLDIKMEQLDMLKTVAESHAEYIAEQWKTRHSVMEKPSIPTFKEAVLLLLATPFAGEEMNYYIDAEDLIDQAYLSGVHIKNIYEKLPSADDLLAPKEYLERLGKLATSSDSEQFRL